MTIIPDGLPSLARGPHGPNEGRGCVMEYVSLLAGEEWSDSPSCTHPVLAAAARCVNDQLLDWDRHLLVPLIPRLFGTSEGSGDHRLNVALALWAAEYVAHLDQTPGGRAEVHRAIRLWLDGKAAGAEVKATADYVAYAATDATYYAVRATQSAFAAAATAAASAAYTANATADGVGLLSGLIDEYDRLTGRNQPEPLSAETLCDLATAVAGKKEAHV